ncbi:hypothetical protein PCANC_18252 [Puccinia coronata f. sp. avenae]|uniref:Uncharacterized protein n=1 Tax=Puccinia coronata f. sp. avenae TaxID=200324 RepID=A0A2N5UQZ2_9BASI|nr:hypothetical protein PCANC_18252 [Puccinia coronata f. sp. avenae]
MPRTQVARPASEMIGVENRGRSGYSSLTTGTSASCTRRKTAKDETISSTEQPISSKKIGLLKYSMSFHKIPEDLFSNENLELTRLYEKRNYIVQASKLRPRYMRLAKFIRYTICVKTISQSLRIAKDVLRGRKAHHLISELDYSVSRLENVVTLMKTVFKEKINAELFSNHGAEVRIGPLDQDSSNLVFEKIRGPFVKDLERLLKVPNIDTYKNEDDVDDLLNAYRNTIFLTLNIAREFGLFSKQVFTRILNTEDTLLMIARSDLTSKFTDGFYKNTSELNSLKSSWRKALDVLIQEIHPGHYQGYYRAEEARQYKIFLDKEDDTEKFNVGIDARAISLL